jgi:hypothetical protein
MHADAESVGEEGTDPLDEVLSRPRRLHDPKQERTVDGVICLPEVKEGDNGLAHSSRQRFAEEFGEEAGGRKQGRGGGAKVV